MKNAAILAVAFTLLSSAASHAGLPDSFSCYSVAASGTSPAGSVLDSPRTLTFQKTSRKTYQLGVDGDEQPYLLSWERDPETHAGGLVRMTRGMGGRETAEFGLDFYSDQVVDSPLGKMAVVQGVREMDEGFSCAVPLADFRALGGRFEVADEDDSANHHTCAVYSRHFVDRNDPLTVYLRDLMVNKGYHLVDDPKEAEFNFSYAEIQYCYASGSKGPPWWLYERGYAANLNVGPAHETGHGQGPQIWNKTVDSAVLFKIDLATPRFYRLARKIPSCGQARKRAALLSHP